MTDKAILFVDTNAFLQLRDLKDLPWREILPGVKTVDLMIAPQVINELDKFKNGTSDRKRNRAIAGLALIDLASEQDNLATVLRADPFEVRLVISAAPRFDWTTSRILDPAKGDDHLVAEALSFGNGAAVFSADRGPRIRARSVEMKAYKPNDTWFLPPEVSDDQKKVSTLTKQLDLALQNRPSITAHFKGGTERDGEIVLIQPRLSPLSPTLVMELTESYLNEHPMAHIEVRRDPFGLGTFNTINDISEHEVDRYETKYEEFRLGVKNHFADLHNAVETWGRATAVRYVLKNYSPVVASGLRLEFALDGEGTFVAERKDAAKILRNVRPPKPPERPKNPIERMSSTLATPSFRDALEDARRDPIAFYWVDRPKIVAKNASLECDEFRATRVHEDRILVIPGGEEPWSFGVELEITATHLPAPVKLGARFRLVKAAANWSDPLVQSLLPSNLRTKIQ